MDKWMSQPTALKIVSVIIALLLWAVVHFDQDTPATTVTSSTDTKVFESLAIRAEGLDETKYALVEMEPTVVRLAVQGRRSELLTATNADYQVKADLSNVGPGEHIIPLKADLPNGVQVTELSPSTIKVEVVEIETKAFDLKVVTEGEPANGYLIGDATVSSDKVNVVLPKDEMPFVASVQVKVDIDGASGTVTNKKAQVVVYDTEGKEMTDAKVDPETVEVSQAVLPPSKKLPLRITYSGSMPQGVSIDTLYASEETVVVYAKQEVLDSMDSYPGVVIDLSKLTDDGQTEVELDLLDGVVKTVPSKVTVTYKVDQAQTKTLTKVPIQAKGLGDGLKIGWETPAMGLLDVNVTGSKDVVDKLQTGDVKLTADLTGLGAGTHTVELTADLPDFVYLADGQELTATVVLSDAGAVSEPGGGSPSPGADNGGETPDDGSTGVFEPGEEPSGTEEPDSGDESSNGTSGNSGETNAGNGNTET